MTIQEAHIVEKTYYELTKKYEHIEEDYSIELEDDDWEVFVHPIYEGLEWCNNETQIISKNRDETFAFIDDLYKTLESYDIKWDYVDHYAEDMGTDYDIIYIYW